MQPVDGVYRRAWPTGAGERGDEPWTQCRLCGRSVAEHRADDFDAEVQGRARMAQARQVAGAPLDELDRQALGRSDGGRSRFVVATGGHGGER